MAEKVLEPENLVDELNALRKYTHVHIVGLSDKPERASYRVARYLKSLDHFELFCVRPKTPEILGFPCCGSLADAKEPVEIVDVFRASEHVPGIVDEAIEAGAKVLWLQEGVTHPEAEEKAKAAGMLVFSDICIKKVLEANGGM